MDEQHTYIIVNVKPGLGVVAFIIYLTMFVPTAVYSAEWSSGVNSRLSTKYTENLLLSRKSSEAVWGNYIKLGGFLETKTLLNLFRFSPDFSLARYSSMSELDNEISTINMLSKHNGVNYDTDLLLKWKKDTTLTSEFNDTGLVQVRKPRELRSVSPSVNYDISERMTINLGFNYTDVVYQNAQSIGLVNYNYKRITSMMNFRLGERQSISTNIYGSQLKAAGINNVVIDLGFRTSYQYTFYPRTRGLITIGMHQVDSEIKQGGVKNKSIKSGFIGDVSISGDRRFFSWKMSFQRTVKPSGYGLLLQNDRVDIEYSRKFSPLFSGKLDGFYFRNRPIQANRKFDSRRYYRITAKVIWRTSRDWELSMQYGYKWQEFSSAQYGVGSSEAGVAISYRLNRK